MVMKLLTLIVSIILIVINILAGLILKDYHIENVIMSTSVLMVNALLLWWVAQSNMKDAFKVSYHIIFPVLGLIEFILAIVAPSQWENNFYFIGIILCLAFQVIMVFAAITTTQHNNKHDNM